MILTIDCGNSNPNVVFWPEGHKICHDIDPQQLLIDEEFLDKNKAMFFFLGDLEKVVSSINKEKIFLEAKVFISSVREDEENGLNKRLCLLGINEKNIFHVKFKNPFGVLKINYASTLGVDRLVQASLVSAAIGYNHLALMVDSGTFTTIDLVAKEHFLGGHIYPGVNIVQNIYSEKSGLLARASWKNEDLKESFDQCRYYDLTKSLTTAEAINQGSLNLFISSYEKIFYHFLSEAKKRRLTPRCVFSGGMGKFYYLLTEEILKKNKGLEVKVDYLLDSNLLHKSLFYLSIMSLVRE